MIAANEPNRDVKWAMRYLGYSTAFPIYQMVAKGKIPHYRLPSGVIRFRESELETWLAAQTNRPRRRKS